MEDNERFWSKVKIAEGDACWEWQAARLKRSHDGSLSYGIIGWRGRSTNAHRVAWELTNGPIPDGLWVLHDCDNQGCVRPSHLYLGNHADNTLDAVRRRRMIHGEASPMAKIREVDVTAIRAMAAAGFATERIGPLFGISGSAARAIVRGKNWKHVA